VWSRWYRPQLQRMVDGGERRASTLYIYDSTWRMCAAPRWADAAISALIGDMARSSTAGDPITLDEYFWNFFVPGREKTSTHKNVVSHRSNYRAHVAETFGSRDIGSISNQDIQRWIDGLPPQSASNYVRTLRAVLNQAAFDHIIDRSPIDGYRFRMPRGRNTAPLPVWGAVRGGRRSFARLVQGVSAVRAVVRHGWRWAVALRGPCTRLGVSRMA
jgi:hypothetical protein